MFSISGPFRRRGAWTLAAAASLVLFSTAFSPGFGRLSAQQGAALRGTVTDPQGAAVARARVRLYARGGGLLAAARTDESGAYRIRNLPAGEHLLSIEDETSNLAATATLRLESGQQAEHDLELEIQSLSTQVVVTASDSPQPVEEVAKALDTVESGEIRLRAEDSLAEALRLVPGVRVRQRQGPGSFTTITTRGLRNQDTAVLIDGLRFRDAAGTQGDASAFLQDMMIVNTDRIEFLRGSGSSLYGSHAMAGVMNIVSDHGGGGTHGEISAEGGGLGLFRGVARLGGELASGRLAYSGGIAHSNVTQGVDGFDPFRNSSGQGFARYQFTPKVSLSGRVWASDSFSAQNESPTFVDEVLANHPESGPVPAIALPQDELRNFERNEPFVAGNATYIPAFNDPDGRRTGDFVAGALIFKQRFSPLASYQISYHGVSTQRVFRDGPAGRGSFEPVFNTADRFDGRIDTLQARSDLRLGGAHQATIGYEFEREEFLSTSGDENPDPALRARSRVEIDQRSHSLFAHDQIRLADGRLHIGLSGRVQGFELDTPSFSADQNPYRGVRVDKPKTALTGDAAVAWFFRRSGTKLRAHAGNAYRAPAAFERFGATFFLGSPSFWGDPRLAPERSIAFDAGVDQWFYRSRVQASATIFYTNLQEVIVFDFGVIDPGIDPFGRFGGYRNRDGDLARGTEFSLSAAPTSTLNLRAAYTYTNSDSRRPTIPGESFFKVLGISDHQFSLLATQRIGRRFDVTFDFFAASQYPLRIFGANRRLQFDGPWKADVVAQYSIPVAEGRELQLYGKMENVFDNEYHENGFTAPGIWGVAGLRFRF